MFNIEFSMITVAVLLLRTLQTEFGLKSRFELENNFSSWYHSGIFAGFCGNTYVEVYTLDKVY